MIAKLETKRLILRPFELSDIDRMSKINASTKVMRYFPEPYSIERTVNFIEGVIAKYQKNKPAVHACVCKRTNELMGSVGVTISTFFVRVSGKIKNTQENDVPYNDCEMTTAV